MALAGADDVEFGAYRLSVRERTLSGEAGPVALPSRAFDVLLALIESRSAVISKDELMRRVWGRIVVQENNLHVQIAAVRRALGRQSRDIQTVPGRGYRFIGDLRSDSATRRPPPARSWRPPGNLPVPLAPLVGREAELDAVCSLFEDARLVSVVGPPGVGKTRLAQAVATRLELVFGQGCWWVDMPEAADVSVVGSVLAVVLGVHPCPAEPVVEHLAQALRLHDALLVLDGGEQLLDSIAVVAWRLLQACPNLRILYAGQAPLGLDGEHVRRLAPLALPPRDTAPTAAAALRFSAVRLFAERAGAVDGDFTLSDDTAADVIQVCRELDGLPLAIELAAARAPLIGLEPLRAGRGERLALLDEDWRETPWRPRALRTAVGRSLHLLPEPARRVLRCVAGMPGAFTLDQARDAGSCLGMSEPEVVLAIGALVQRSLLMVRPDLQCPRYWLLHVVRDVVLQPPDPADRPGWFAARHVRPLVEADSGPMEHAPSVDGLRPGAGARRGPAIPA